MREWLEGLDVHSDLSRVVDALPGLVWTALPQGDIDFLNQRWSDYTGLSPEEAQGSGWQAAVHPDDLPLLLERWPSEIASGARGEMEARLRRFDGEYRWFLFRTFPLADALGQVEKWCGTSTDIHDRRRTEKDLRNIETNYSEFVESFPGLIVTMNMTGKVELFSREVLEYFGKTAEELRKWQMNDAVHPDDQLRVIAAFTESVVTGMPYSIEHRCRRADGVYRWFHVRALAVRDGTGQITGWYVVLVDIDDLKQAESAMRANERNLTYTINTIPAMAWSASTDGHAEFVNQHYLDFTGLTAEQASGWGWTSVVHPDDLNELAVKWNIIMGSQQPGETEARLRRHDGQYRWFLFRAKPLRDESGKIVRWYGVNTDIEDLKEAEDRLRRSQTFLLEVQRVSHTGGWRFDLASNTVESSAEIQRFYDPQPGEDVSKPPFWFDRIHPEDRPRVEEEFARSLRERNEYQAGYRIVLPNGTIRYQHVTGHPIVNELGDIVEFIGAAMDMTEHWLATQELGRASEALRELQATMSRAAQVATVGEFAASMAHEVNQPLSGIVTNANTCLRMLASDPPNVDGARETAKRTIRDGNRASDVIARLRALFSRKELVLESLDLNEATREVVALSSTELQRNNVIVRAELADDLPSVTGDRVQLQQVILNLLRNASDAMAGVDDRVRQLTIRTGLDEENLVRLTVQDLGQGFDPRNSDKLFVAFFTTKAEGMGIGLSVSRSIIERHHGRLWAAANEGPGATFAFSIPQSLEGMSDARHSPRSM